MNRVDPAINFWGIVMHARKSALTLLTFLAFGLSAFAQNPQQLLPPPADALVPAPTPWQTAPPPVGFAVDPDSPAALALDPRCDSRFRFQVGTDLFIPQIHQNLQAPVNVGNLYTTTVMLPTAEQDLAAVCWSA